MLTDDNTLVLNKKFVTRQLKNIANEISKCKDLEGYTIGARVEESIEYDEKLGANVRKYRLVIESEAPYEELVEVLS